MSSYRVIWEIELEADSPLWAAREAEAIHLDRESIAKVFTVIEREPTTGQVYQVDLGTDSVTLVKENEVHE